MCFTNKECEDKVVRLIPDHKVPDSSEESPVFLTPRPGLYPLCHVSSTSPRLEGYIFQGQETVIMFLLLSIITEISFTCLPSTEGKVKMTNFSGRGERMRKKRWDEKAAGHHFSCRAG